MLDIWSNYKKFISYAEFLNLLDLVKSICVNLSDDKLINILDEIIDNIELGCPFAYLVGNQPFYNVDISIWPGILIPRNDTEVIVDYMVNFITKFY